MIRCQYGMLGNTVIGKCRTKYYARHKTDNTYTVILFNGVNLLIKRRQNIQTVYHNLTMNRQNLQYLISSPHKCI